jgi:diacyltrehalose acyltransferase
MTRRRYRWLGASLLASAGVGLLEMASMPNPAVARADDTALIMGYAGTSDPDQSYVNEVMSVFLNPAGAAFPGQPLFPDYSPLVVSTPEGDYQQALTTGVGDLDQAITQQLGEHNNVVVFGYSESSAIATQEMVNLDALPANEQPNPADLQFVLVEDLNNPNGGFLERFPFLATESFPATPADSPYQTDIYNIEYSGSSDVPQYPLNILADLNATAGYVDLHPFLLPGYPTTFNTSELAGAVLEPTSPGYSGATEYFMIPTQDLPLLDGLRDVPGVGPAMADLIQPDLRVIVDLGYNWTGYADVDTPADTALSPSVDWTTVSAELAAGAQQGMTAAEVDLGMLPTADLPNAYPYLPDVAGLESGLLNTGISTSASSAETAGALDISGLPAALSTYLPGATSDLSALIGSSGAAELTSVLTADLLPSLTTLFANPLDLLSW